MDDTRLGSLLLDSRVIDEADLEKCLEIQSLTGSARPLGHILIEQGLLDQSLLDQVLALQQSRRNAQRTALASETQDVDGWFRAALAVHARDLVLSEGRPVLARAGAEWRTLTDTPLRGPEVWDFVRREMGDKVLEQLAGRHCVAVDLHKKNLCRGRITAIRHFDGVAAFVALQPEHTPAVAELGLPAKVVEIVRAGRGLVLLVGERGEGRVEALSAVLAEIARDANRYVVVLDDAIGAELPSGALIARRRVGEHVAGYVPALRTAVREDPDAIVVGSLAHPESFDLAMRAAEGGRLVVGWIDGTSVTSALQRVLGFYPSYDVSRVRTTLASVLRAVCVRHFLPAAKGDAMVVATEALFVDSAARELLRNGELASLNLLMRASNDDSGHSLDHSMIDLIGRGLLRIEDAYSRAEEKSWLLDRSKKLAGKGA
ncbi:twitching motility protein PilT [Planctomycetota bacterium]|jgi:twitching motility protein PilT|nr:ATPase, T2SS/T4P/T4SS family [Planctomycetota bacterium]GDY02712.1 twitching motility protein PilT [Planctomycetota bacterium]